METNDESEFDLFIVDLNGNLRGKRLPASALDKVMKDGVKLPRSVVGFDFWGGDVLDNGLVFETGDSDGICWPVVDQATPVPWFDVPHRQLMAMMYNPDGTPFEADARQVLSRVLQRYQALNLTPVMATELEFYLLDGDSEGTGRPIEPALADGRGRRMTQTEGYSIDEMDGFAAFFADVRTACEIQEIPADSITAEMGPGQFEINLNHVNDPLKAADQAVMFKRLVKGVARNHGYAATFMAKPYGEHSGNGFHVHFSLLDDTGRNVFDNGSEQGSATLLHAVAGLIRTMPDSMLIFAPHLNSYRRFFRGCHAPTSATWGYENRTTAVRIPESPNAARRIEQRVAGADANPYLVLASVLAGALYGMDNRLAAPNQVVGDAYSSDADAPALPSTWETATDQFEASEVLRDYLGEEFVRVYTAAKRQEQQTLNTRITDVEYEAYLGLL